MKLKKAIKILKRHNAWLRGDNNLKTQNPTKLGIAIDTVVNHYKKDKYNLPGYPKEVVKLMLKRQKEQSGKKDLNVFKNDIYDGFTWRETNEGANFWLEVLSYKNFDLFFEKYPKKLNN
jgi:hypothetical protein